MDLSYFFHIIIGFVGLVALAIPFSDNFKEISFKYIFYGILAQLFLALILLKVPFVITAFEILGNGVFILQQATQEGASFVFGFAPIEGGSPYRSLLDGFAKYRFLTQKKNEMPISMAVIGGSTFTYMTASSDISQVNSFPKVAHRFSYFTQVNVARHFGDKASIALMPTYVHRNYVAADDVNDLFSLGGAFRVKLTSRFALVGEYYQVFCNSAFRQTGYKNSLGIALEWFTFGHNFTINLTNSRGFGDVQFITYTYENWLKGQFRLGFCIGRKFEKE